MELTVTGMKIGSNLHQVTHPVSFSVGNFTLNMNENSTSISSFKVREMFILVPVIYFQNIQEINIQEYATENSSRQM